MLVSMKTVLDLVDAEKIAVSAFSTTPLEGVQAILGAVRELGQPVILQFTPVRESVTPLRIIGPVTVMAAEESPVPVCVHLDHGDKPETLQEALKMRLTSVMYDGSVLPFEENVVNTKIAVEVVEDGGASVEVETGAMGRQEFPNVGEGEEGEAVKSCCMDPEQTWAFTALTGIDVLACSFGTVHGPYLTVPKLDFGRIHRIREGVGIPAVIHGGSGASDEDFRKCAANGVRRINYYTYLAKAGGIYVEEKCADTGEYVFFHGVTQWAAQAVKEDALHTIRVFSYLE